MKYTIKFDNFSHENFETYKIELDGEIYYVSLDQRQCSHMDVVVGPSLGNYDTLIAIAKDKKRLEALKEELEKSD